MKTSTLRVTGSVASIASCLVLFGGVVNAQTISDTGRDSNNRITVRTDCDVSVRNDNDVNIRNNTNQTSFSGNVDVSNNDDVSGNFESGDASNTNSSSFLVNIDNASNLSCGDLTEAPGQNNGGGAGSGGTGVTPTGTSGTSTTPNATLGGGRGAESVALSEVVLVPEVQQVVAPTGGVGAGGGGIEYLSGLVAVTLFSGALAGYRLYRPLKEQA